MLLLKDPLAIIQKYFIKHVMVMIVSLFNVSLFYDILNDFIILLFGLLIITIFFFYNTWLFILLRLCILHKHKGYRKV